MKKIMIVEDNLNIRNKIVSSAKNIQADIIIIVADSLSTASDLANIHDIEAFFIDIELIDSNGIDLAKKLRKISKYKFVPMVFITGLPTKELEVFRQIHCYEYILKPFTNRKLEEIFKTILLDYSLIPNKNKKVILDCRGYSISIKINEIIYVEYKNRKIYIKTINDMILYKTISLNKFMSTLPSDILRVHQAFAINTNFIREINLKESKVNLTDCDLEIPIGRNYRKILGALYDESY